jgi:hypothetical protein
MPTAIVLVQAFIIFCLSYGNSLSLCLKASIIQKKYIRCYTYNFKFSSSQPKEKVSFNNMFDLTLYISALDLEN